MPTIAISCVLDNHPKFLMQCWNWIASLDAVGARERAEIVIHYTPAVAPEDVAFFKSLGARMEQIVPFGTGAAVYCNKTRQLESDALRGVDYAILCDTDLLFAACPTQYAMGSSIRAKIVDLPNPPMALCQTLAERAGFGRDIIGTPANFSPENLTLSTNFNGGFYVLPASTIEALRTAWPMWARFCLSQGDLLGHWQHHADQLGFAFAVLESDLPVALLDHMVNFPTHLDAALYPSVESATISTFHYHHSMDVAGFAKPVGVPWIDAQIATANDAIRPFRRQTFNNRIFWNFRYAMHPELGSGIGSRGAVLAQKQRLIAPYVKAFADKPILDIGCGDIETTRHTLARHYLGIDRSAEAITIAKAKRPDWHFRIAEIGEIEDMEGALVLCLDLLIHEKNPERFQVMIDKLLSITENALLVSGYETAPAAEGIVFFHEPLSEAFERRLCVESVARVGQYRDVTLLLVTKIATTVRNPNDIDLPALAWGLSETPDSETLVELVSLSRDKLGFFPRTVIRTLEYPWFARRMNAAMGKRILDVGAGLNVLPFWLAARGAEVVTIDAHTLRRNLAESHIWDEWGFLDYSEIDSRIASVHGDIATFASDALFDVIYSVSVIEHMPAAIRREAIARMAALLAPGGRVLLSLDLVPGTDLLWPLSQGVTVDTESAHGSFWDLLGELREAGLVLLEWGMRREIPASRTDLVFIVASAPAP